MGSGMVRSLLTAGHRIVVYNRTAEKAEALTADGAIVARTLCDACRGEAVITMVSDDAAVEEVVGGDRGILACIGSSGTVHVSASTISPSLVRRLAELHAQRAQKFLSVPMLGRPEVAERGKLYALAAGERELIDRLMPVFDAIAQRTFVVGTQPEAANLVKLACNALIATLIEGLGETLALIAKSGIVEADTFLDVLMSTVLASPTFRPYGDHVARHEFTPGFKIPLALKDMELVLGASKANAVPLPIVSLIRDHLVEAIAEGLGELDWSALTLVAQRQAGLAVTDR